MLALEEERVVLIILLSRVLAGNRVPLKWMPGTELAKKIERSWGWCCTPELVTSDHHPASAKSEGKRGECACQKPDPESSRTGVVDKGCDSPVERNSHLTRKEMESKSCNDPVLTFIRIPHWPNPKLESRSKLEFREPAGQLLGH